MRHPHNFPFCVIFLFFILNTVFIPFSFAQTVRDLYEQAVDAYNKGNYDESIRIYQDITKDSPHFAPAYVGLGLALKSRGATTEEVLNYYKTAVEMDPTNTQALEQLGRLYYANNDFGKAENVFVKALKINGSLKDVKLSLAWIYLLYKPRSAMAVRYFTDILKIDKSPSVYLGLGMSYFANNDRVAALDMITQLKNMNQEEYAKRLEQAIRDNRKVVIDSSQEEQVDTDQSAASINASVQEQSQQEDSASVPIPEKGVRVRLRGKLSQVQ